MNKHSDLLKTEIAQLTAELAETCLIEKKQFPEMVDIPSTNYAVGKYPVTVEQYRVFCQDTNRQDPDLSAKPGFPVVNISWYDAKAYCTWLSEVEGATYRLPTSAEFENFCGDHQTATAETAVYDQKKICEVGTKNPNKFGIYDVLGLVWEWVGNSDA